MTNDTQAPAAAATVAPVPASVLPQSSTTKPKTKPKSKSKPRRTRQRRRAATSEHDTSNDEAGAGDGAGSDTSLSSRSEAEASESEDEPASKPSAAKSKSAQPVFADVSSITPAGWAQDGFGGEDVQPISFEDFNAGKEPPAPPARGTGLSIRGRGGKAKVEAGPAPKREYTPEETAKYEAQKAKRKEKVKAKRAALKEEKLKSKDAAKAVVTGDGASAAGQAAESAQADKAVTPASASDQTTTKPAKGKGKKRSESTAAQESSPTDQLTASTSALTLDPAAAANTANADVKPAVESPAQKDEQPPSNNETPSAPTGSTTQARPPRQPRVASRDAQGQRVAEDPKFTPRTGQFWTHDQRLNADGNGEGARQMTPFWRGRAMPRGALRGGFRGRGRGGFFPNARGGFVNANGGSPRPVELSQEEEKDGGSSKLAMDREYELAEAREKARAVPAASAEEVSPDATTAVPGAEAAVASSPAPPTQPSADRKWGHEGYEAMSAVNQFRGGFRGRVRGARGRGGFFARGGHLPFAPQNQPFHPAAVAARAAAAASRSARSPTASASPANAAASATAATIKSASDDREKMSTQPTADSLFDPADESVKIKFPGSAASVVPVSVTSPATSTAPPPSVPATSSPAPALEQAVAPSTTIAEPAVPASTSSPALTQGTSEPQFPSMQSGSPAPIAAVQAQMYTGGSNNSPFPMGSENGSVGSAQFVHHPGQFYAPGMTPNGEFVPAAMAVPIQQRPAFYPQQSQHGYPAQSPQFYPPQSPYSPGPYDQHQHHRGSFSGAPVTSPQGAYFPGTANGYANGRSSPLNPYIAQQAGGYFAPVRGSSKVAIRAPQSQTPVSDQAGEAGDSAAAPANGHPASQGGAYYAQHYNPYVQPFVPGQRQETVFYPTANGQQYWQGYGEQAYYDGNAAYGY